MGIVTSQYCCKVFDWRLWLRAACSDLIFLSCDDTLSNEFFRIFLQHRLLFLYLLVHQGLCEHRLVHLIMAIAAITHLCKTRRVRNTHI